MKEYLPPSAPFCTSITSEWLLNDDVTYHLTPKLLLDHHGNIRLKFVTVTALAFANECFRYPRVLCSDGLVRVLKVESRQTEELYVSSTFPIEDLLEFCLPLEEEEEYYGPSL